MSDVLIYENRLTALQDLRATLQTAESNGALLVHGYYLLNADGTMQQLLGYATQVPFADFNRSLDSNEVDIRAAKARAEQNAP